MRRLLCALLVVVLAPAAGSAQLTVVRGRVTLLDDAAVPLRGARVTLLNSSATADPVFTDADGRFSLGVPAGFTLRITKAGFASAAVTTRDVASGEVLVRLGRGGVITGRVADELGFPVVNAGVRARRADAPPGSAAAGLVEFATETDDRGEFRIGSLPDGRYTVHSEAPSMVHDAATMFHSENDFFRLPAMLKMMRPPTPMSEALAVTVRAGDETAVMLAYRMRAVSPSDAGIGGSITGTVVDDFGDPVEGLTVRAWGLRYADGGRVVQAAGVSRETDDRGEYRLFHLRPGRYLVSAADDDAQSAMTYHPDTTVLSSATPITVRPSQQTPGAHVRHTRIRHARVAGVARSSAGAPLDGTVMLTDARRTGSIGGSRLTLARGGTFEFTGVPPGQYMVRAVTGESAARSPEVAVQPLLVTGADVPALTLVTAPTANVSGRIVLEGAPADTGDLYFAIAAAPDPDYVPYNARRATSLVTGNRTFEIRGLVGPTRFTLLDGSPGWWLKSVDIQGVNAAEEPVTFSGARDSRDDVTIVLSSAGATVAGRVRSDDARAVDDYRVVLFPARRDRWFAGSRYIRMVGGPDADGGYTLNSVRPGEYFIVAISELDGDGDSGEWQDPEVLDRLSLVATKIAAGERQQVTANLTLVRR